MQDYLTEIRPVLLPWLLTLAPWDAFCTFTFELPVSVQVASTRFSKWQTKQWKGVPCFYAVEWHGMGHQAHIHALMALRNKQRKYVWQDWFSMYGRNRIVPVTFIGGAAGYCAKYCVKEAYNKGWWDVLQVCKDERAMQLQGESTTENANFTQVLQAV